MAEIFLTKEGLAKLKEEYRFLVEERRPGVARKIKEARELGDISENAEYDSAREEQAFVEGRILELKNLINKAKIFGGEKTTVWGTVRVGSRVKVRLDGQEDTFEVVGAQEADPLLNRVSHESPLGRALLGRQAGDKVEVGAPVGRLIYTIIEVK